MKKFRSMITMLLAVSMLLSLAACGSSSSDDEEEDSSSEESTEEETEEEESSEDTEEDTEEEESSEDAEEEESTEVTYVDSIYIGEYNEAAFVQPTFDPTGCTGSISNNGQNYMIYDVLFYVTADGDYDSRVVDSYEWEDDTHMVITIKDGIYFSNGDQLLGDDILYSLEKRQESSMRSTYYQIFLIDECSVSDDGLTITLVTESANSVYMSGLDFAIMDKDYIEEVGWDNIDWSDPDQVVGSGPYEITDFVADSEIHYTKRDDYWGLEYGYDDTVEEYVVYNYSDQSTMCIDLETGVIDLAINLTETDYSRLQEEDSDEITTALINGNVIISATWDVENNEYLADDTIREALCYALDTEAMTEAMNGSYGGVATSMLAENELGYVGDHYYEYDPDYASELLESAGISEGEISLTLLCYSPYEPIATVMESNLADVGVSLDVQVVEVASYWGSIGTAGESDIMLYGYSTANPSCDPATHLSYWLSTSSFAVMRRDYDDLLLAAQTTLDEDERISLYEQLQDRWYENFDAVPVCEYLVSYAYRTEAIESLDLASTVDVWLFDGDYVG